MKVVYSIGFMILLLGALKAQRNISVLLLDDNNMALKAQDVAKIEVSLCGQDGTTIIYSETFLFPTLVDGLANLEIGSGAKNGTYTEAVNNHFKNLVTTSEVTMIVKIDASLLNGKLIKFNKEISLNDPVPVIKVYNDQSVVILPQGISMNSGTHSANFNARELFLEDSSDLLKTTTYVDHTGIEVFLGDTSDQPISSTYVDHTGMILNEGDDQTAIFNKDGINIFTPNNKYAQFLFSSGLKLQDNNFTSEFSLNGGSILNRLNEDVFNFSSNEFSLGNGSGKHWTFNLNGSLYTPDVNNTLGIEKSYFFNDNKQTGHTFRLGASNLTGTHNQVPILSLGMTEVGNPYINFVRKNGKSNWGLTSNIDGAGDMNFFNNAGLVIGRMTTVSGSNGDLPYWYISNNGGAPKAGLYFNTPTTTAIFASVKNFRMDHPLLADQDIVYASLEGPEAAAYCRGKSQISNGKIFIPFPEHFKHVCSPDDLTVQLTPRSAQSKGLAVTQVSPDGFQVEELQNGTGNYEFYWEVKGTRKGFEDYRVIRPKSEIMPVPFKRPETKE